MDNAECHMTMQAIEYANDNGIVILTLPPHTTDKLQPLDVSIYASFKTCMRTLINNYNLMHPHTHITEHRLPEFASQAWIKACTPSNVLGGFRATGIWPINTNVFPDEAFLGAEVTERAAPPAEDTEEDDEGIGSIVDSESIAAAPGPSHAAAPGPSHAAAPGPSDVAPGPSHAAAPGPSHAAAPDPSDVAPGPSHAAAPGPSHAAAPGPSDVAPGPSDAVSPGPSHASPKVVTPESVRPYPKATPRPPGKGRKRVRSCILTANEEAIEMLRMKNEKKRRKEEKKTTSRTRPRQRQVVTHNSSEEEDEVIMQLDDSSEYSDEFEGNEDEAPSIFQDRQAVVGDFVLVELELEEGRNAGDKVHYVGKVMSVSEESGEFSVSYLRLSGKYGINDTFYFPVIEDTGEVSSEKVLGVLCEPVKGRTQRLSNILKFPFAFDNYGIH